MPKSLFSVFIKFQNYDPLAGEDESIMAQGRQFLKLLNTHFEYVENITDGRFVNFRNF
jgi:hypothetical protein